MIPIIIWAPLEQHHLSIPNQCPKCDNTLSRLIPIGWTNGQSNDNQPRLLYCVNFNVILVSRIYQCDNGHHVLAHHPGIIELFNGRLRCLVPFQIGFTVPLVEYITNQCEAGVSLRQIEKTLVQNRLQLYLRLKEKYEVLQQSRSVSFIMFPEYDSQTLKYWRGCPQHHAICAVYLKHFWVAESTYHHHMATLSVVSDSEQKYWLSCDHTFKSVRNIGIMRRGDNKWINQFKGMFCVINAAGQIVTWIINGACGRHNASIA